MKIPVRTENGWQIDAILDTTYVATKDGETVKLEADTLEQMELLIALLEGLVKYDSLFAGPTAAKWAARRKTMANPKCPYCGGEMRYAFNGDIVGTHFLLCENCLSRSPVVSFDDDPYAAATKRDRAKGKWILVLEGVLSTTYRCSHCGNYFAEHSDTLNAGRGDKNYCPNCGAEMKEKNDE